MRHTKKNPTEMKTSREAFEFLEKNCERTDRDIFQKKGIGIYRRKFHWAGSKEAPALHQLADVKTVDGSDSWHMFYDTGHTRHILVREIACFSCEECKQMRWRCCKKLRMCGPTMSKEVIFKSANRVDAPLTKSRLVREAQELALKVATGDVLGAECSSEQEPFILVKAVSGRYEWQGRDEYTWMGWVRAGDWVVDTVKFEKYGNGEAFWSLQHKKRFPIFEEDLRSIITGYEDIESRKSVRITGAPAPLRIEVTEAELNTLKERVLLDLTSVNNEGDKARGRPRRGNGASKAAEI